jgi:hypothetical protein
MYAKNCVILVYGTYVVFVCTKTSAHGQRTQEMQKHNNVSSCGKALPLN